MSICWHRYLDVHLAAPAPRVRDRRSDTSAGSVPPEPRRVLVRRLPSAASFSRWLLDASHGGGQRDSSFRALVGTPSASAPMFASLSSLQDGAGGGDALTYRDALDALARTNRRVVEELSA